MLEYTRGEPPMEIKAAGNSMLRGTAQGMLQVVERSTDDALRTVKLAIVLVLGLQRMTFSSSAAAKKGVRKSLNRRAHLSILERSSSS